MQTRRRRKTFVTHREWLRLNFAAGIFARSDSSVAKMYPPCTQLRLKWRF